jgi:hypothetical protein
MSTTKCVGQLVQVVCDGVRGDAVGRHSALQSDRSRVRLLILSLGYFINLILLAALWP